jgi:very-short-patch-repair endonuclease/predicted transcriptional regulator of viral defense system
LLGCGPRFVDVDRREVAEIDETRPESMVRAIAARQHGVVTTTQLVAAGWSKDAIANRRGWLRRLHRGVYLVGLLEAEHSQAMAATLAIGPGAVLSHYPAAVLWALRTPREEAMHVTVAQGDRRNRPGIVVHRASLHPRDITRRHGIPVTSAARTLLDLAATEPTIELERALNEAGLQRRVSPRSLTEQFSRYPRHRGTAALRRIIETEPHLTRSDAEILMRDLIRRAGLPPPEANVRIEGHEVDLVWRAQRLVVEIDSWAFHSLRRSFEGDRRRDQVLVGKGWRVIRITARQLTHEPERVAATLATTLAA